MLKTDRRIRLSANTVSLLLCALLSACTHQADRHRGYIADSAFQAQIGQGRAQLAEIAAGYPGLSVAVGVGDRLVWTDAWGMADIEQGVAATPDTRYALYSVAKPVTGLLTAKLVIDGTLDPAAPVVNYLSDLPAHYSAVTAEHLLAHTAGIRHYHETDAAVYAPEQEWMRISSRHCNEVRDALPVFINDPLVSVPGESHEYTSFGYTLLSRVVEGAAGRSFAELLKTHIFKPSGAATIGIDNPDDGEQRAVLYTGDADAGFQTAPLIDNSCRFGGGGLVGSAADLALIGLAYANGTLLPEEGETLVQTPILPRDGDSFTGYGFGVGAGERDGVAFNAASHGGAALGGRSYIFVIPSHDVSVAIAGNLEGAQLFRAAFDIGYAFAGIPASKP